MGDQVARERCGWFIRVGTGGYEPALRYCRIASLFLSGQPSTHEPAVNLGYPVSPRYSILKSLLQPVSAACPMPTAVASSARVEMASLSYIKWLIRFPTER